MNIDKKTCINIGIVTFLLYLAIHYCCLLYTSPSPRDS